VSHRGPILLGIAVALSLGGAGTTASSTVARTALVYDRNGVVIFARIDGTHPRPVAAGSSPRISPDGRWIAFTRAGVRLYVVPAAGGTPRLIARRVDTATWGPDSSRLLAEHRTGPLRIVELGGRVRTLASGLVFGARFSPDGRSVVYSKATTNAGCGFHADVYRVGVAGGARQKLTQDERSGRAVWGARGIAFTHDVGRCGSRTIWLMRPDGSGRRPVVPRLPTWLRQPGYYGLEPFAWLPDGRLLGEVVAEFRNEAAVVDVRTGHVRRLHVPLDAVSRDGRWIVGTASGAEYPFSIVIAPVGAGHARTIARGQVCCADWNR
jgi:Tol biopolymer transport system component